MKRTNLKTISLWCDVMRNSWNIRNRSKTKKNKWFNIPSTRTNEFQLQKDRKSAKVSDQQTDWENNSERKKDMEEKKMRRKTTKNQMIKNILIGHHQTCGNGTGFNIQLLIM